jgi:hypothetical protein
MLLYLSSRAYTSACVIERRATWGNKGPALVVDELRVLPEERSFRPPTPYEDWGRRFGPRALWNAGAPIAAGDPTNGTAVPGRWGAAREWHWVPAPRQERRYVAALQILMGGWPIRDSLRGGERVRGANLWGFFACVLTGLRYPVRRSPALTPISLDWRHA